MCPRHSASSERSSACARFRRGGRAAARDDAGDHLLAPVGVRAADDGDLGDVGVQQQDLLDFARIDVRSAADDEILGPILEREVTVGVEAPEIAGVQPAVRQRAPARLGDSSSSPASPSARARAPRRFRRQAAARSSASPTRTSIPVWAMPTEPSRASSPRAIASASERAVHRGDRHRRLALAVDLREPRTERGERGPWRRRRTSGLRHRRCSSAGRASHCRARAPPPGASPSSARRRSTRGPRRRAAAQISSGSKPPDSGTTLTAPAATCGRTYRPEPCDSGAGCSSASPGATASTHGEEAPAHRAQVAVRDHDALRPARRAARVEQPRGIGGCARCRRGARRSADAVPRIRRRRARRRARARRRRCRPLRWPRATPRRRTPSARRSSPARTRAPSDGAWR